MRHTAVRTGLVGLVVGAALVAGAGPASATWRSGGASFGQQACLNSRAIHLASGYPVTGCWSYTAFDPNSKSQFPRTFWTHKYWVP
ncbi:hypothetical protein GTR02_01495 [Kineococcus sp. R8]|uniref:hypothetical protein n=1 Tax=Kineococcus siccus TaxID=2696567 RepID=UPI001412F201|nr:hypothetical protein [Kineococcus siccus]NAZ80491.1 hypothetical protein [Kineococcus siccus]